MDKTIVSDEGEGEREAQTDRLNWIVMSSEVVDGECKWFDKRKGHGFLVSSAGEDVFV